MSTVGIVMGSTSDWEVMKEAAQWGADKISGMWSKVTSWFKREPGQAHQTTTGAPTSVKSGSSAPRTRSV